MIHEWNSGRAERERDEAYNAALEAAAMVAGEMDYSTDDAIARCILALRKPVIEPQEYAAEQRSYVIRSDHSYMTRHTYTGPGCAMCGLPESQHREPAKDRKPSASPETHPD